MLYAKQAHFEYIKLKYVEKYSLSNRIYNTTSICTYPNSHNRSYTSVLYAKIRKSHAK